MNWIKGFLQKLANFYNTNAKFHSFVVGLETTAYTFLSTSILAGGIPSSKRALVALAIGLGGALWAWFKRWAATNLATKNLQLKNGN